MEGKVYHFRVKFGDTDAAGIVFYPNYYKWMDEACHHFLTELGFPTSELIDKKIGFPIVEATCQFKAPLLFADHVFIRTSIRELKDKSFILEHHFIKQGRVIASGHEKRVWANFSNGKLAVCPIPSSVRVAFANIGTCE
ncbi:acyl-CoA thioesterase [Halalkalibacterium halodurans]|uniref:4-hydroxybenzoyl-CoA thioesterase n=1 Tax=Halalkalibacterium halodurans (strain ATCC BAA-125 / DSM 18197 / FERM 7344 / JCM 9153 / C-125) TaxID=272558 RepID=Q9KBC9_HALH5|nr:thioesterase family protein [Halalkalibacterium halodurans]5WH9_A Chain A, 4-hydroxybenzoyl-CoA thioesterase [Halalkalibacterium halodurans C-125]5WH9_B Chain B, 4-hydroxybenzoyl-CoA thioesterase [Halalkalibacterium halodurans C-125]5WH9_C Chain C, 4-hydroxybenzoyl-CoA thioesterase [Halalkalibacterium halodurans C-125]5WH9_D Chain D, 4-hydroxybenzoyl-CoA thioesterase [Halalkalibacterium halodurans C-125]MDY7222558.1 thioesterase family protein [Halalkalibacterium halodurans]MDY7241779.1 th